MDVFPRLVAAAGVIEGTSKKAVWVVRRKRKSLEVRDGQGREGESS